MLICRITLCTDLCGSETCANMALFGRSKRDFLREFLALEHGIPSHDTFSRVFRLLDPRPISHLVHGVHAAILGGMPRRYNAFLAQLLTLFANLQMQ